MTRTLAIAHRGFSARYPENTLTAYRAAIEAGADLVESDARLSRDGVVWCCHDATLARLTGDSRAVADLIPEVCCRAGLAAARQTDGLLEGADVRRRRRCRRPFRRGR